MAPPGRCRDVGSVRGPGTVEGARSKGAGGFGAEDARPNAAGTRRRPELSLWASKQRAFGSLWSLLSPSRKKL